MVPTWDWCFFFFFVSCYIYFKGLAVAIVFLAGCILFIGKDHGKGRVGIDGCWQSLDRVYDVFSTCILRIGVYKFSAADVFLLPIS